MSFLTDPRPPIELLIDLIVGRPKSGEGHHAATISDADIVRMRAARLEGFTYQQLATRFACSRSTVADVCKNRRRSLTQAVCLPADSAHTLAP